MDIRLLTHLFDCAEKSLALANTSKLSWAPLWFVPVYFLIHLGLAKPKNALILKISIITDLVFIASRGIGDWSKLCGPAFLELPDSLSS